jgi:hypothetical protein
VPFLPGSPSSFLPLVKAPNVMKFFIVLQSLRLCLIGYEWFGLVTSTTFSKWSFGCLV